MELFTKDELKHVTDTFKRMDQPVDASTFSQHFVLPEMLGMHLFRGLNKGGASTEQLGLDDLVRNLAAILKGNAMVKAAFLSYAFDLMGDDCLHQEELTNLVLMGFVASHWVGTLPRSAAIGVQPEDVDCVLEVVQDIQTSAANMHIGASEEVANAAAGSDDLSDDLLGNCYLPQSATQLQASAPADGGAPAAAADPAPMPTAATTLKPEMGGPEEVVVSVEDLLCWAATSDTEVLQPFVDVLDACFLHNKLPNTMGMASVSKMVLNTFKMTSHGSTAANAYIDGAGSTQGAGPVVEEVVVWEWQRWKRVGGHGAYSPEHLIGHDPGPFILGVASAGEVGDKPTGFPTLQAVPLPGGEEAWCWTGPWEPRTPVDTRLVDAEGWQYASGPAAKTWAGKPGVFSTVRRRSYQRVCTRRDRVPISLVEEVEQRERAQLLAGAPVYNAVGGVTHTSTSNRAGPSSTKQQGEAHIAGANAVMADNVQLMHENREKLEELSVKADRMNNEAMDMMSFAKQIREAEEKKAKWF